MFISMVMEFRAKATTDRACKRITSRYTREKGTMPRRESAWIKFRMA